MIAVILLRPRYRVWKTLCGGPIIGPPQLMQLSSLAPGTGGAGTVVCLVEYQRRNELEIAMPPRDPELSRRHRPYRRAAPPPRHAAAASSPAAIRLGAKATERLVGQVREQVSSLRGQAERQGRAASPTTARRSDQPARRSRRGDRRRRPARSTASSARDYGDYAHRASGAVSGFADNVRDKDVDDLIDDTREFVRKSPAVAIGIAAVVGFALVRLIKTGLDDVSGGRGKPRTTEPDLGRRGRNREEEVDRRSARPSGR